MAESYESGTEQATSLDLFLAEGEAVKVRVRSDE